MSFVELRGKEVINVIDGRLLGNICDVIFDIGRNCILGFLVPGTKFNWDGSRQGHGKGYYDRYLAKFPNADKAGIATPAQISETPLEQKDTDIKMNTIIACRDRY